MSFNKIIDTFPIRIDSVSSNFLDDAIDSMEYSIIDYEYGKADDAEVAAAAVAIPVVHAQVDFEEAPRRPLLTEPPIPMQHRIESNGIQSIQSLDLKAVFNGLVEAEPVDDHHVDPRTQHVYAEVASMEIDLASLALEETDAATTAPIYPLSTSTSFSRLTCESCDYTTTVDLDLGIGIDIDIDFDIDVDIDFDIDVDIDVNSNMITNMMKLSESMKFFVDEFGKSGPLPFAVATPERPARKSMAAVVPIRDEPIHQEANATQPYANFDNNNNNNNNATTTTTTTWLDRESLPGVETIEVLEMRPQNVFMGTKRKEEVAGEWHPRPAKKVKSTGSDYNGCSEPVTAAVAVAAPHRNDVFLGQSPNLRNHPGNVRFRELIAENFREYGTANKKGKTKIAGRICDALLREGRRFLKQRTKQKIVSPFFDAIPEVPWEIVAFDKARAKVSSSLRGEVEKERNSVAAATTTTAQG